MYPNLNAPPTLGANLPPNLPPNVAPVVAPMPTYTAPVYGFAYGTECPTYRNDFILIVVLFILLIIVGASFYGYSKC